MEIIRKFEEGTELRIALTDDEVERAYRERRCYYHKCALIHKINLMLDGDGYEDHLNCSDDEEFEIGNRTVTGKQLKELIADDAVMNDMIDEFENGMDNNDYYWESYWITAENVIEDMIDEKIPKSEKELKQDANWEKYKKLIAEIRESPLDYKASAEIINKLINEGV
jgi:hypothetical protein